VEAAPERRTRTRIRVEVATHMRTGDEDVHARTQRMGQIGFKIG
jgi:hypothetical protein